MSETNTGPIRLVRCPGYRVFDAMPPALRRAFAEAAYDFSLANIERELRQRKRRIGKRKLTDADVADLVADFLEMVNREIGIEAFVIYGSEHPQARPLSRASLRKLKRCAIYDAHARWRQGDKAL